MWFKESVQACDWSAAETHLRRVDPPLGRVIGHVGACTLRGRRDYFVSLCQAIVSQQVSTSVATILYERFRKLFPYRRPVPGLVLKAEDESLRGAGLSRQKMAYLRDLAEKFESGSLPVRRFTRMADEQIIESLTAVHGVGRWTAEMFLIFVLNRTDVLPVDDLGLRKGVQMLRGLVELPGANAVREMAERWRPYRSIATWYLWRGGSYLSSTVQ